MADYFDDEPFFKPQRDRKEVVAEGFAKLGIGQDQPLRNLQQLGAGSRIFEVNNYLRGSTLSSIGRDNGRQDARGKFDLMLWRCIEHPRLEIMVKIYPAGEVSRTFLVDGIPYSQIGKAAHELEVIEAKSGIYPRPRFEIGDPEGDRAVS